MAFEKNLVIIATFIILGTLASQALSRTLYEDSAAAKYDLWMAKYGRVYLDSEEKERRFAIFKNNVEYVEKFNRNGNNTYKLGINEFADLSHEEFIQQRTGYIKPTEPSSSTADVSFGYESLSRPDVPFSIDWRMHGAVTPVKRQGPCGSCWAFSAVAALEGIVQIRTGHLRSLSEQQLVDCSGVYGNKGCQGGNMVTAFEYILQNRGIASEVDYPYQATEGRCDTNNSNWHAASASITGYEIVPRNSESDLIKAVAMQPVSIGIHVTWPEFRFYKSGVFTAVEGCGTVPNHGVTIVGYGNTIDGTKYWVLKNQWGESWGENGYMRILRNAGPPEGLCGLATMASYPTVD